MLTDAALRNLKPKAKPYKASDRNGLYVTVLPSGTVTFRYDYLLNGRRETLTLGRYGAGGISLPTAPASGMFRCPRDRVWRNREVAQCRVGVFLGLSPLAGCGCQRSADLTHLLLPWRTTVAN